MSRFVKKSHRFDEVSECAEWGAVIYPALPPTFPSYNHCKRLSSMAITDASNSPGRVWTPEHTEGSPPPQSDLISPLTATHHEQLRGERH
jgi:hypothetical protein